MVLEQAQECGKMGNQWRGSVVSLESSYPHHQTYILFLARTPTSLQNGTLDLILSPLHPPLLQLHINRNAPSKFSVPG